MAGLIALAAILAFGMSNPAARGSRAAKRDIRRGKLVLRGYGLPAPYYFAYVAAVQRRLGVTLEMVGGCTMREPESSEADAYNDVMKREIARRFGPNALSDIDAEVQAGWYKEIQERQQSRGVSAPTPTSSASP